MPTRPTAKDTAEKIRNVDFIIGLSKTRFGERSSACGGRLTTKLSDGALTDQHAGAQWLGCATRSIARGRALYANRRSLQRLVRRRGHRARLPRLFLWRALLGRSQPLGQRPQWQ